MARPRKGVVPPHLRRFLFKKGSRSRSTHRARPSQVKTMSRRRYGRRRSGSGMGGLFNVRKLAIGAALGVGATMLAPQIGNNDLLRAGAGFVVAGPAGAIAAYGAPKILPSVSGSTGGSGF